MKTTLNLNDRLLRAAKRLAAEKGTTLTAVIEDALRASLTRPPAKKRRRLRWVAVKGRGLPVVDVADRDSLYDVMEGRR